VISALLKNKIKMKNKSVKTSKAGKKSFKKGDQCVQNPSSTRFRDQVKKSAFTRKKSGGLTIGALQKHDEAIEDEIEDFSELALSDKESVSTKKSTKAFSISGLTDCTNITFNKVWEKMNSTNSLDQEKCAILAAVTEVIRSRGGVESESEYFAALMTALECYEGDESALAIIYLLSLVIKKIPTSLLKLKFSEASKLFVGLLEKFHEDGRSPLLLGLIECVTTLLLAQDSTVWVDASTLHCYQILLTFAVHAKPKIRKLAHYSLNSVIKINMANHKNHPIGKATATFVVKLLEQYTPENSTAANHVLNLLKQCLQYLNGEHLKEICEAILRIFAVNNLIVKTNSMQTLHALFTSNSPEENLSKDLNIKVIAALYDFQPSMNDVHIAEAWMSLMTAAHANLSILDGSVCLKILPRFYATLLTFFQSEHRSVTIATANIMKETSGKCLEPCMELIEEDIERADSSFLQIFELITSGLRYKYQPVWDIVLKSLQYLYLTFGGVCSTKIIDSVSNLIDLHDTEFPYINALNKAVGAALQSMGPKIILDKRPLNLIRDDDVCEFPRAWLLPIMKEYVQKTEMQYFISHLLPISAKLREKSLIARDNKQDLEAKVFETLQSQLWSILPGFFTNPVDLKDAFKNIAKILGTALTDRSDLRPTILQGLRTLINKTQDEEELKVVGSFSKNYLPILFNLYTSDDESCQAISLSILETIKGFLMLTDKELLQVFIVKVLDKIKEEKVAKKRHSLMDLAVSMVKYSDENLIQKMYELLKENIKSKDKSMQKKSYRILEEICDSNSEICKNLIKNNFDELKVSLAEALSNAVPSSKAPRLHCLSSFVKRLEASNKDYIVQILPEIILCTKEVGVKAKTAAFELIVDIGTTLVFLSSKPKEEVVGEYFQYVMAGLAGSPHMISATLLAFTKLMFEYRYCISTQIVATLLDAAISLLRSKEREVIKSSLYFIRAVVKILDANELSGHLERLIKNLFAWNASTKSAYRQQVRIILERLDKKCGYQLIRSLVPEAHRRFIVQIHKTMERTKRQKETKRNSFDNDDTPAVVKKENRWEDILADSDDESKEEKREKELMKKGKNKLKNNKTWIVDGEDTVDLLDPKISKNITATKPKRKLQLDHSNDFSMSTDGKFIINDEEENSTKMEDDEKLDIGQQDMLAGFDKTPKQIKLGKRRHLEEMPEDDAVAGYQPGGQGIHRQREEDMPKRFGEEYKAKKARGDMKVKGKPDPFAYIPLDRQKLNKRKRAKLTGQYDGMVKAARKGADKGKSKFRKKKL